METLKYKIIKTEKQYFEYCDILENLICQNDNSSNDEIELLELLINKWENDNLTLEDKNPIDLIKSLMVENKLKAKDLVKILDLSKGTISKILNYQKGLSKDTIRKLSKYFKVSQEAFNRPYKLKNKINRQFRNAKLMNTKKDCENMVSV